MKIKSLLPFLPFFSIFLLVGYWTGHQIAVSAQQPLPQEKETGLLPIVELDTLPPTSTPPVPLEPEVLLPVPSLTPSAQPAGRNAPDHSQLAARQRNLLVIGVDDLVSPSPRLAAVWLVIYQPGNPHFMLLPVYPSQASTLPESDGAGTTLAQLFQLDESKTPRAEFLAALEGKGLWWTGYLILDKVALVDVFEFMGGAGEFSELDGANTIASLPSAAEDPQQALFSQARLLQELCGNVARMTVDDHWRLPYLFSLIPEHAMTNLDLAQVKEEWLDMLMRVGEIACEYPSLSQTSFHP